MAFPTTVQLKQGMEKVETSSQKHKLGTRGVTSDGRIFYYAENSGTAIDHGGYLVDGIAAVAAHDMDVAATAAHSVGDTTISIEVPTTDLTANQYKDGYLYFNDGPGQGETYMVKSHPAHDASDDNTVIITIDEEDGFVHAISAGASAIQCGLAANPYLSSTIYQHDAIVGAPLGWSVSDVASGSFGWMCVKGLTMALCNGAVTIGLPVVAANDTLDGAVEALDSDDDAEGTIVGYMGNTVGADTEYSLIKANIQ